MGGLVVKSDSLYSWLHGRFGVRVRVGIQPVHPPVIKGGEEGDAFFRPDGRRGSGRRPCRSSSDIYVSWPTVWIGLTILTFAG